MRPYVLRRTGSGGNFSAAIGDIRRLWYTGAVAQTELERLRAALRDRTDAERAQILARFFKTGPGQYGEGDRFLGATVPMVREISRQHRRMSFEETALLLQCEYHEERLCALLLLVQQYRRGTPSERQAIFDLYLRSTRWINNWDLVDVSAEHIVGPHLEDDDARRDLLLRLSLSALLWDRRIAMMSTFHGIKRGKAEDALYVAELLLQDEQDLINKAVGWMLREVGKRCHRDLLYAFLDCHGAEMPRVTLRYAIEHLDAATRQRYMGRSPVLPMDMGGACPPATAD